jgi:hypothetical protein
MRAVSRPCFFLQSPERSVAMGIELEEEAKPVAKPAFRLSPAEMDELKKQ